MDKFESALFESDNREKINGEDPRVKDMFLDANAASIEVINEAIHQLTQLKQDPVSSLEKKAVFEKLLCSFLARFQRNVALFEKAQKLSSPYIIHSGGDIRLKNFSKWS